MVILITKKISERLKYIATTILTDRLGIPVRLTENRDDPQIASGNVISYGLVIEGAINIPAHGLLFEETITPLEPVPEIVDGKIMIFRCGDNQYSTTFDLFSAVFYLLSRYEEYLPFEADQHGRFESQNSWLVKHSTEQIPIADQWIELIEKMITGKFKDIITKKPSYRFSPTIDIDNAWAFLHKPLLKQAGGVARSLFNKEIADITLRFRVLRKKAEDPYDTYNKIFTLHEGEKLPLFFILMGSKGKYDRNLSPANNHFRKLIKEIAKDAVVGIHPSYGSFLNKEKIKKEIQTLEEITNKTITKSRQHFLRLSLPYSYQILEECGIEEDYSLGFADRIGFRAGTSQSFRFFDLEQNRSTSLTLFPLTMMEGTLRDYMHLTSEEATEVIKDISAITKRFNGHFVSLWHNESLGEWKRWSGWTEVYKKMIALCKE